MVANCARQFRKKTRSVARYSETKDLAERNNGLHTMQSISPQEPTRNLWVDKRQDSRSLFNDAFVTLSYKHNSGNNRRLLGLWHFVLSFLRERNLLISLLQTDPTCRFNIYQHSFIQHVALIWPPCWTMNNVEWCLLVISQSH